MSVPPPLFPPPPSGPEAPAGPPPPSPPPPRRPGRLVGALVAIAFWVLAVVGWFTLGGDHAVGGLLVTLVASVVGATVALVSERLQPYAAGFLIASGVMPIVLGGACIGLIAVVTGSH